MRSIAVLAVLAATGAITGAATAENVVFAQDFNDNTPVPLGGSPTSPISVYSNTFVDPSGQFTAAGLTHDGSGLGWTLTWADTLGTGETGPIANGEQFAPGGGDLIGVAAVAASLGAFPGSTLGLVVADPDGEVRLTLDSFSAAGLTDLSMRFDFGIAATTWEATDRFAVLVNGDPLLELAGEQFLLDARVPPASFGGFGRQWLDLSAYDGLDDITVAFIFTTNSDAELLAIDTIEIGEALVPSPGGAGIIVLGALALTRRVRGGGSLG